VEGTVLSAVPAVRGRRVHCNKLRSANALCHKLAVQERRSLASYYTSVTDRN